jgi:hypothetical protein
LFHEHLTKTDPITSSNSLSLRADFRRVVV